MGEYLGASIRSQTEVWGLPHRIKPRLRHLLVGLAFAGASYALLWSSFAGLLADTVVQILNAGGISATKLLGPGVPTLAVGLLDGSTLNLVVTWNRSGLFSMTVFGLLMVFSLFPLEGPIWLKTLWMELGFITGLVWSLFRMSATVLIAYHFGLGTSTMIEFFMNPLVDFLWIVSIWSLALSRVSSYQNTTLGQK